MNSPATVEQLFQERASVRIKQSGFMAAMGDIPMLWPDRAYGELIRQHPWLAGYQVIPSITAQDDRNAVGFFQVAPVMLPAAAKSRSDVNTLTVPIIIKDAQLFPFDLYAMDDIIMPLTRSRAERALRISDIFTDVTQRELRSLENIETVSDLDSANGAWGPAAALGPYSTKMSADGLAALTRAALAKTSAATVPVPTVELADQPLAQAWRDDPVNSLLLDLVKASDAAPNAEEYTHGWERKAAQRIREKNSQMGGVEVDATSSGWRARAYWVRHPIAGGPAIGDWEKTSASQLADTVGTDAVTQLLRDGGGFIGALEHSDATVMQKASAVTAGEYVRALDSVGIKAPAELATWADGSSKPKWLHAIVSNSDGYGDDKVGQLEVYVAPNEPTASVSDDLNSYERYSPSSMCIITKDGTLLGDSFERYGLRILHFYGFVDSPPEVKRLFEPRAWKLGSTAAVYGPLLACVDPAYKRKAEVVRATGLELPADLGVGETAYQFEDSPTRFLVPSKKYVRPTQVEYKSGVFYFVPSDWKLVPVVPRIPESNKVTTLPTVTDSTESVSTPASLEDAAGALSTALRVDKTSGGYMLECSPGDARVSPLLRGEHSRRTVKASMSLLGIAEHAAEALLMQADANGSVSAQVALPDYGRGDGELATALQKVSEVRQHAQTALRGADELRDVLHRHGARVVGMLLKVSTLNGVQNANVSLDGVLSLGFLNRKNLDKFVAATPALQEAQSRLCALLLASRLGLHEIPEDACETAIQALEPILTGLRSISFALSAEA